MPTGWPGYVLLELFGVQYDSICVASYEPSIR